MTRITFVSFQGEATEVDALDGASVMETALNNAIRGIDGDCGGQAACATCHVFVEPEWLDRTGRAESDHERGMLELTPDVRPNSRLACQIRVSPELEGLRVRLPESQF